MRDSDAPVDRMFAGRSLSQRGEGVLGRRRDLAPVPRRCVELLFFHLGPKGYGGYLHHGFDGLRRWHDVVFRQTATEAFNGYSAQ
jgi:hypothetical protein